MRHPGKKFYPKFKATCKKNLVSKVLTVLLVSDSKIVLYQSFFLEITLKSDALCLRANSTLSGLTFTWKFNAKKENSKVECLRAILIRFVVKEYLCTSILAA